MACLTDVETKHTVRLLIVQLSGISKGQFGIDWYSRSSIKTFEIMPRDLEVICGLVRYPASLLHCSRPPQGGVRALITLLGPKVLMCL